jgi:hypothetical protein
MIKKSKIKRVSPILERFLDEYAPQICLDGVEYDLPDWVFDYREEQIRRIGKNGKALYQRLKDIGVDFKVKYPVERSGRGMFSRFHKPVSSSTSVPLVFRFSSAISISLAV